ncbi:MAG: hypothetical protein OXK78_13040, partial [Caldilineaceae bacterium]|nr:hypothetical protein [Caldilineaceae bacterium]
MHTETTPEPSGKDENDRLDPNPESSPSPVPPQQANSAPPDRQRTWSRRRFLAAAAAGLGVLVGACSNGEPSLDAASLSATSSTPGSYKGYLPWVQMRGLRPAAVPVFTPTPPKATLTPFPTDTPVPTNTTVPPTPTYTPTPTVTPFPPGPPSKLGIFITRNHPSVFNVLRSGGVAVVKTLELDFRFARQIKEAAPTTRLIGRIDLPQLQLQNLNAKAAAQDFVNRLWPIADHPERRLFYDG